MNVAESHYCFVIIVDIYSKHEALDNESPIWSRSNVMK